MPSSIAVNVRGALKTALANVPANIFDAVPETEIVPFVALLPSNPYLEPNMIGTSTRVKVNLTAVVAVAGYNNAASLDNIETLCMSILGAIPSGYTIQSVSDPRPVTLASGSQVVACEIDLSTQYTQTN